MKNRLVELRLRGLDNIKGEAILPLRDFSVITGKNGSGKTRFLDLLSSVHSEFAKSENTYSFRGFEFFPAVIESQILIGTTEMLTIGFVFDLELFTDKLLVISASYKNSNGKGELCRFKAELLSPESDSKENFFDFEFLIDTQNDDYFNLNSYLFNKNVFYDNLISLRDSKEANDSLNTRTKALKSVDHSSIDSSDKPLSKVESDLGEILKEVEEAKIKLNYLSQPPIHESKGKMINSRYLNPNIEPRYLGVNSIKLFNTLENMDNIETIDIYELKDSVTNTNLNIDLKDIYEYQNIGITSLIFICVFDTEIRQINRLELANNYPEAEKLKDKLRRLLKSNFRVDQDTYNILSEVPLRIKFLSFVLRKELKSFQIVDFTQPCQKQSGIPDSVYNIFHNKFFTTIEYHNTFNYYLNYWIIKFEIGEFIKLNAINQYFEIKIQKTDGLELSINELSKGERKVVFILLIVACSAFPLHRDRSIRECIAPEARHDISSEQIFEALITKKVISGEDDALLDEHFEAAWYDNKEKMLYIEEPEAHLHPNSQSLLADLLVDAFNRFGINFVIETHSEYLIRKIQFWTSKDNLSPQNILIGYMDRNSDEFLVDLKIQKDGTFKRNFGSGFFDEATRWKFELLKSYSNN